jgi:pilus assembly protein CpaB
LGVGELKEEKATVVETPVAPVGTETPVEEVPTDPQLEGEVPVEEPLPDVISLIVTPQDAVSLNYLIYSGAQLTLALRPATDDTRVQTEAATLDFLLKQYNIPVPVKLPYGMQPSVDELAAPTLANDTLPTPEP